MDMMKMMKQAASMKKDMAKKQKMLAKKSVTFTNRAQTVSVSATCDMKIKGLEIQPEIVNPAEIKKLEIAILESIRGAITMAQNEASAEMKSLTKGMDLPF